MKKAYVTPTVEKVEFQYDRAVVASSMYPEQNRFGPNDGHCDYKHNFTESPCTILP